MSVEPSELLHYLPVHKALICTSCQYALQPTGISRHLKDIHHILRSNRKPFLEYVSSFELNKVEDVVRSSDYIKEFPVPELPVYDGLRCNYPECPHLCITEKRMKNHWSAQHGHSGNSMAYWSVVPLQTFFRGNSLRYFTKPAPPPPSLDRDIATSSSMLDEGALFQHYIDHTSLTLTEDELDKSIGPTGKVFSIDLWCKHIPKLAESSEFLKNGTLACAALHLAYLYPVQRQAHWTTAAKYEDLATSQLRHELTNPHDENCHAIIACIHILGICAFAHEQEDERLLITNPSDSGVILNWLALVRAGCDYIQTIQHLVKGDFIDALLCHHTSITYLVDDNQTLLLERLMGVIPSQDSVDVWSEKECRIYADAARQVASAFVHADQLGSGFSIWHALRLWPMLANLDFFDMLQNGHPGALITLAHYCALLQRLDETWYCKGRARRMSVHIVQRLDSKWHRYLDLSFEMEDSQSNT